MRRLWLAVRYLIAVALAGVGTASLALAAAPQIGEILTAHHATSSLPDFNQLAERSVMYDVNGAEIQTFSAAENRNPVKIADVPKGVIDAVTAVEDAGFYKHAGVNVKSLLRATLANVAAGDVVQGGSTITQQVVKLGLVGSKRDAHRKITEAIYAIRLEQTESKDQILERYLNTVYFGNGAYGVTAAAETYFGKTVPQMTMADGAFIAGIIRNPAGYDPFRYPQRFLARRRVALDRLVSVGKMMKSDAEFYAAQPLPTTPFITADRQQTPTYFVARAKAALLDDSSLLADTSQERYNALFTGGLKIYTTFDPRLQAAAQKAHDLMPSSNGLFDAALASVDPRTGAVKALVGGPGFDKSQFDLSTQGRNQAGSSFKTFALVAALEGGAQATDVVDGGEGCTFDPLVARTKTPYAPTGHGASPPVGPLSAMYTHSINCAFIRLGLAATPERVQDVAERMGIPKGVLHPYASLPLGTFGVSPLNMAAAYGTLAADGVRHDPYYVERIEDRSGNVLYQHQQRGEQVVFPAIARSAISIMKGVLTDGTGVKARLADREAAGKTGTTNNSADVWFVGFTPELSTAVWIGSPLGDTESVRLNGKLQVGGDFPAQIWHQFMTDALAATPPTSFPAAPAPKSRPVNRIILPGDECWATTPTISDPANPPAALGPADYSIKAPPASATLDPRLRAIPMVPNDTTSVVKCGSIFPGIGGGATPSVADTTTTTPGSPVTTPASPVTTPASAPPTVPRTAATVPPATTTTVNRGP